MTFKTLLLCIACCSIGTAHAQESGWAPYFANDALTVTVKQSDCNFPENGLHDRYMMLRLENTSEQPITVAYTLDRSYNGKAITPDTNGFSFTIPAKSAVQGSCEELTKGLHIYVKILSVEAKSVLSNFAISNLQINGKAVAR